MIVEVELKSNKITDILKKCIELNLDISRTEIITNKFANKNNKDPYKVRLFLRYEH